MTSTSASNEECTALQACFDDVWACFDEIFESFSSSDWSQAHGDDWTFADLPYHLAYFDLDLVSTPLEAGDNYPDDKRWLMQKPLEIDGWNRVKFDERPADQTAKQSLEQWHVNRDAIRRTLVELTDSDLETPVFSPFTGVATTRDVLITGIAHTWGHLSEARIRLDRDEPKTNISTTKVSISFYVGLLASTANTEAATKPFRLQMEFPSIGTWHIDVNSKDSTMSDGPSDHADFTMIQSPETFSAVLAGIQNPITGMITRKIKIKGFTKLPTFGKVFPQPGPDDLVFERPDDWEQIQIYT